MSRHSITPASVSVTRTTSAGRRAIILGLVAAFAVTGCASTDPLSLPEGSDLVTGSLPDPTSAASGVADHVSEMAAATGLAQAPGRKRLDELFALDRKCYSLTSQDEVWQAVKAEQKSHTAAKGPVAVPPVSNPWTDENKAFYKENCSPEAKQARSREMRSLSL